MVVNSRCKEGRNVNPKYGRHRRSVLHGVITVLARLLLESIESKIQILAGGPLSEKKGHGAFGNENATLVLVLDEHVANTADFYRRNCATLVHLFI
jgi:hypothetical protein